MKNLEWVQVTRDLTLTPSLTPGADAVPSPTEWARVIWYCSRH